MKLRYLVEYGPIGDEELRGVWVERQGHEVAVKFLPGFEEAERDAQEQVAKTVAYANEHNGGQLPDDLLEYLITSLSPYNGVRYGPFTTERYDRFGRAVGDLLDRIALDDDEVN